MRFPLIISTVISVAISHAESAQSVIRVEDSSVGCFHHNDTSQNFVLVNGAYVSGEQTIPSEEVERIQDLILSAPTNSFTLLASAGITTEWISQHRSGLIWDAVPDHWKNRYGAFTNLPQSVQAEISTPLLEDLLREFLAGGNGIDSTTTESISIIFPGSSELTISSSAERPGKLPFKVQYDGREWNIYSFEVAKALQQFTKYNSPNRWTLDFQLHWEKGDLLKKIIERKLERPIDESISRTVFPEIPGFENVKPVFEISKPHTGTFNMEPLALVMTVKILQEAAIDEIWCWIHLSEKGEPLQDWNTMHALYEKASKLTNTHTWLNDWKNSGVNRRIQLTMAGEDAHIGIYFERDGLPAWEFMGLEGEPEYVIYLREGNSVKASLYLGADEERGLLLNCRKNKADDHWLDKLSYPHSTRSYILVKPSGAREVITEPWKLQHQRSDFKPQRPK